MTFSAKLKLKPDCPPIDVYRVTQIFNGLGLSASASQSTEYDGSQVINISGSANYSDWAMERSGVYAAVAAAHVSLVPEGVMASSMNIGVEGLVGVTLVLPNGARTVVFQ